MKMMNRKPVAEESEIRVPAALLMALEAAPLAEAAWNDLTPIGRRDFISWINEAKLPETRRRRIERCCENLVKGKRRPCCFAVVPMDFYRALGESPVAKAKWSDLTATEKRNLTDWIEAVKEKGARKSRVEEACALLMDGRRCP